MASEPLALRYCQPVACDRLASEKERGVADLACTSASSPSSSSISSKTKSEDRDAYVQAVPRLGFYPFYSDQASALCQESTLCSWS